MKRILLGCIVVANLAIPLFASAKENIPETVIGKILSITNQREEIVEGTTIPATIQELSVKISEGTYKGRAVDVENDITPLKVGDRVYLTLTPDEEGNPSIVGFGFAGPYRLPVLGWLTALFVVLVIIFGGRQGIRGLASLLGGLALIVFGLLPGLLHGFSPIGLSIGISALIMIVGSYITHGFNRTTTAAIVGMVLTVIVVGLFSLYVVHAAHLTGMNSEEALYLTFGTGGQINLIGLLLGGILIGLLGVLYDIAIGQAISVEELRRASPDMPSTHLYRRATRIGREHIGALVNVLAIAYVGASLPLLLLFYSEQANFSQTLNNEIVATEIVRILIGSIGLVIAVPITTVIAVAMLKNVKFQSAPPSGHSHAALK